MKSRQLKKHGGFSIIEVVIAIGIVTLVVVSLVGLILPIQNGLREGNLTAYASRYLATVEEKLNIPEDSASLATALQSDSSLLLVYQVRVRANFPFEEDPTTADLHPTLDGGVNEGYRDRKSVV